MLDMKVGYVGDWRGVVKAMRWLDVKSNHAFDKAVRAESRDLAKRIKMNLRKGGSPSFAKPSRFTRFMRRVRGIPSRKAGLATRQLLHMIKHHRIRRFEYFSGVLAGTNYIDAQGRVQDAARIADWLESGRKGYVIRLDQKGPSGKTPRQFLWWLYLKGATKNPPSPNTKYMKISPTPPRPFVGQVARKEMSKIPQRIFDRYIKEFWTFNAPSASGTISWSLFELNF